MFSYEKKVYLLNGILYLKHPVLDSVECVLKAYETEQVCLNQFQFVELFLLGEQIRILKVGRPVLNNALFVLYDFNY